MKTRIIKQLNTLLSAICLIIVMQSCEDIINLEPRAQLTIDLSMTTLEGIEGAMLGVYERGRFIHSSDDFSLYKLCHSDLIKMGNHLVDQAPFNEYCRLTNFSAENTSVRDIWNGYYTGLSRANKILEEIPNVDIDENVAAEVARRNTVQGEALFFRAYFHTTLIQRWERIVLSDHVFDDPADKGTIADPESVYNLIVQDLTDAIALLPEATPGNPGKASKAVARHLLSLVYMDLGMYSDAAGLAVSVCNDPAFSLADVNNIFGSNNEDQNGPEILFSWQYSQNDQGNSQRCAQQLTPLYDRVDGVARTFEQGGRPWARLHPSDYYWTLFEEEDLRLEAWHKREWYYDDEANLPAGVNMGDIVTPENVDGTSGYEIELIIVPTVTKYWEDSTYGRTTAQAEGWRNITLYRVSQAYLTAAEAYLRDGNVGAGQPYLDAVRARAGLAPITLDEANLIDEHARELGLEGHRYAFLKRNGILYETVIANPEFTDLYLPHHVRWPIPQVFVDITKVEQNEGYR